MSNEAVMIAAFNIAQFEASESATFEMLGTNEEPIKGTDGKPVIWEMWSPGTEHYVKAQAKIDAASQTRMFAAMRGKAPKDGANEQRRLNMEKLAACTKSISSNFPIEGGASAVYDNPKLGYMTAQASKFLEDWVNFPPASQTS